jgi:7,8-dihydropterin-6-yl-methyl-4-(beta-D-ribofuranosyl)aminobenzene 5'-phosphate synthase
MAMGKLRITALVENTAGGDGLLGEHGLSLLAETAGRRILLDCGGGATIRHNARALEAPLSAVDTIALSHGHYDHSGGLNAVLTEAHLPVVRAHPAALESKYVCRNGRARKVGLRNASPTRLRAASGELVLETGPADLGDGLLLTGEIPRVTEYEDTGGPFYADPDCSCPDTLPDDQALVIDTAEGLVVLLGCAHAGVVNTLLAVRELTGGRPVRLLAGGMHLRSAEADRLDRTVEALLEMDVARVAPAHCTGPEATARLYAAFGDRCAALHVGSVLEL